MSQQQGDGERRDEVWQPPRGIKTKLVAWAILAIVFLGIAVMAWVVWRGF